MFDPFDVLGVVPGAPYDEIRAAWRRRAYETHPDRGGSDEAFRRVQQAYEDLANPVRRRGHELRRAGFGSAHLTVLFAQAFATLFDAESQTGLASLVGQEVRLEVGGVRLVLKVGVG